LFRVISVAATVFKSKYFNEVQMKKQGKLNMQIIFESLLMLLTDYYQNYFMLVKTAACQSRRVF